MPLLPRWYTKMIFQLLCWNTTICTNQCKLQRATAHVQREYVLWPPEVLGYVYMLCVHMCVCDVMKKWQTQTTQWLGGTSKNNNSWLKQDHKLSTWQFCCTDSKGNPATKTPNSSRRIAIVNKGVNKRCPWRQTKGKMWPCWSSQRTVTALHRCVRQPQSLTQRWWDFNRQKRDAPLMAAKLTRELSPTTSHYFLRNTWTSNCWRGVRQATSPAKARDQI